MDEDDDDEGFIPKIKAPTAQPSLPLPGMGNKGMPLPPPPMGKPNLPLPPTTAAAPIKKSPALWGGDDDDEEEDIGFKAKPKP